jgi:hypothetical protein
MITALAGASLVLSVPLAHAQPFAVTAASISCGGRTSPDAAGPFTLASTIGDPLAGSIVSSGQYSLGTGFIAVVTGPPPCYANCDGSTTPPVLNVLDFSCFLNKFAAGDAAANCDGSTTPPVLNVLDFSCFLNEFAAGCP